MISDDVFPERGGPRIITECSGRNEAPSVCIVAEIRAVSGARQCIQSDAMSRCDALSKVVKRKNFSSIIHLVIERFAAGG